MNDKALERQVLLQDVLVVVSSLALSHLIHGWLVRAVPGLKPAVPSSDYVHLLLVFLPTWAWCAERVGLHRVRTLAGPLLDVVSALVWTQALGAFALGLILTAAQALLNRSLIAVYLVVSTVLLLATKLAQRAWIARIRGELVSLALGPSGGTASVELAAVHGRRVETLHGVSAVRCRRPGYRFAGQRGHRRPGVQLHRPRRVPPTDVASDPDRNEPGPGCRQPTDRGGRPVEAGFGGRDRDQVHGARCAVWRRGPRGAVGQRLDGVPRRCGEACRRADSRRQGQRRDACGDLGDA